MSNETGEVVKGKITSITKFGAFVALEDGRSGLIHISEVSEGFVKDINDFLKVGQTVKAVVRSIDEKGRMSLSLKQCPPDKKEEPKAEPVKTRIIPEVISDKKTDNESFEAMMSRFMKTSGEKISDLKKTTESKMGRPGFSRKNSKKY